MNDKYTMSICSIIEHCMPIFDFDYPLSDKYKREFEETFVEYYYFSEIFCYFPKMFKQRLRAMLLMKAGYYDKLLKINDKKFNPLITREMKTHGIDESSKINTHNFETMRNQLAALWEESNRKSNTKSAQNISESGETSGAKSSDTEVTGNNKDDEKTVVEHSKDSETNTVTTGESDKVTNVKEEGTSESTHRVSDTPQNDLSTLSPTYPFGQYLSMIEDTRGSTTGKSDSTENIKNEQITDTSVNEDGNSTTQRNLESDQESKTKYGEEASGTHSFVNDEKKKIIENENIGHKTDTSEKAVTSGEDYYTMKSGSNNNIIAKGFENTSLSRLINEWRDCIQNTLSEFVREFESLFMGVF